MTPGQSLSFKLLISASSVTLDMMRLWIWSRSWIKQLMPLIKLLFVTKSSPPSTRLSRSMKPSSLVIITTIFLLFFKQPLIQLMLSLLSALHQLQVTIFKSSGKRKETSTNLLITWMIPICLGRAQHYPKAEGKIYKNPFWLINTPDFLLCFLLLVEQEDGSIKIGTVGDNGSTDGGNTNSGNGEGSAAISGDGSI